MKSGIILQLLSVLVVILLLSFTSPAQTTEFTYQGYLNDSSQPANGSYDFEFALFDALASGNQIGSTLTRTAVAVSDGKFTVRLDFGPEFPGANRYLEIRVTQSTGAADKERLAVFTTLTPRQPVTSTPYAVKSLNATNAATATNATQLGGINAGQFVLTSDPRMTDTRTPTAGSADYIQNTTTPQTSSNFNISGTGDADNFNAATEYRLGGTRVIHTFGSFNTFIGQGAGNSAMTGFGNTVSGYLTLSSNTTGEDNAANGRNALQNNTTGKYNTASGAFALYSNETGLFNTAFGNAALYGNTSGTRNIALGVSAGSNLTTGNNNIAIGNAGVAGESSIIRIGTTQTDTYLTGIIRGNGSGLGGVILNSTTLQSASNFNISGTGVADNFNAGSGFRIGGQTVLSANGTSNIFVGRSVGASNTGTSNTFVGYIAGQNNTSGNGNSFFGRGAGASNSITNDNSFFGYLSGASSTGGVRNSFFGMSAGYGNTTGDLNVFLGGYAGDANTTGSSNTAVGYDANFASGGLQYATAVGAKAQAQTSNQVQLGRDGLDSVRIGVVLPSDVTQGPICIGRGGARLYQFMWCDPLLTDMSNIKTLDIGLEVVKTLRPVAFDWKNQGTSDIGLVAEEVERTEPQLATKNSDGKVEGVKYNRLSVVLVNAVKEQQKQIEKLQSEINQLRKQQTELEQLKALVCSQNKEANICQ